MSEIIWQRSNIVSWNQILLNSYRQLLGAELIQHDCDPLKQAKYLFFAPFVLVSHGTEADPILNYGNQTALKLWELNWDEFTRTPSRQTAEPMNREERQNLLSQVTERGYIDNYRGVRISRTGKRFAIDRAIVWNLTDFEGKYCGQAATFASWSFLP
jgi:MEKHLA domain